MTDDVPGALSCLAKSERCTTVTHLFRSTPDLAHVLSETVAALAHVARSLWPSWYSAAFAPTAPEQVQRVVARVPRALERWIHLATERVRLGALPLVSSLPLEIQAAQLALAIDCDELTLVLALADRDADDTQLYSFARASEWLAERTGARIIVVLPEGAADRIALDSILYGAERLAIAVEVPVATRVYPVGGRPHPMSATETSLARALERDAELSQIFELNQRIETVRGSGFIADLLWREGRIVVEVDGWATHGNRFAFAGDRHRDYELTISDYLVLRVTNEEIEEDTELVLEKIRDLVRFRRSMQGGS